MEYNFIVKHRKGITHNNADALSRLVPLSKKEGEIVDFVIDIGDIACKICIKTQPENNMLLCDFCGDAYHINFHQPNVPKIPLRPWYCKDCLKEIQKQDTKDITVDFNVINYLNNKELPDDIIERNRIKRRSISYILQDERIFYIGRKGLRLVPTKAERRNLIKELHSVAGHQSYQKTLQLIQQNYAWANIHKDIIQEIKLCPICIAINPKYNLSEEYIPTEKGTYPFEVISIDLITNLPKTKRGNLHIIVAIDAFSKFVELAAIPSKHSINIYTFLVERILYRHGCPRVLRSDQGKEFMGAIKPLIDEYKIQHRLISAGYPQANAQAERTVQTVQRILKKFMLDNNVPIDWDEALPYVERSLRSTTSKSTNKTPFEILYGRIMRIPESISINLNANIEEEPSEKEVKNYSQKLIKHLSKTQKQVNDKLNQENERQLREHQKRYQKFGTEIKFKSGQAVYLQRQRHNKLKAPVQGPFIIQDYTNRNVIELINPQSGAKFKQNVNQLAPVTQI